MTYEILKMITRIPNTPSGSQRYKKMVNRLPTAMTSPGINEILSERSMAKADVTDTPRPNVMKSLVVGN